MAKIDLITLTGFTAVDGSVVQSGATIKFDSEFHACSNNVIIRFKVYRNRELFEAKYSEVKTIEIPNDILIAFTEEDLYTLTPAVLYSKVRDYLNNYFGDNVVEVRVIQ